MDIFRNIDERFSSIDFSTLVVNIHNDDIITIRPKINITIIDDKHKLNQQVADLYNTSHFHAFLTLCYQNNIDVYIYDYSKHSIKPSKDDYVDTKSLRVLRVPYANKT